jgi:hypothetical protein
MEKPKYYGKQTNKEKYPFKKKDKSKEKTYIVEDDKNWDNENEDYVDYN